MKALNARLALAITDRVGTMWTAYAFVGLALVSLPAALASHNPLVIVAWIAQTFLQLVLLPVIMVGQSIASTRTETTIQDTHREVTEILADIQAVARAVHAQITGADAPAKEAS